MSERKIIVHRGIMVVGLMLSAAALPFSIKVCHAAIIIVIFSWLFEGQWRDKVTIINNSLLLQLTIGLFFLQVVGLAFSDNLLRGWFTVEKRIFFLLLPVVLATTAIRLNEKEVKRILITFVTACFAGTVLCIMHAWTETNLIVAGDAQVNPYLSSSSFYDYHPSESEKWMTFSYVSLSEGIALHPTYFSIFLAFCLVFLLWELPRLQPRLLRVAAIMLMLYFAIFILFLATRITTLGLAVIFLFVLVRSAFKKQKSLTVLAVAISVVFSILLVLNPVTRYRSLQEINTSTFRIEPGNNYKDAAKIRFSLWWLAFKSLDDTHPLVGAGTGNVEKVMARTGERYEITNIMNSYDPHNQYLHTLLANGYVGLLLLVLCLALPLYFAWLQRDYLVLGFLFLFCMLCFTESALELQKGIVFYSLFSGLLFFQLNSFQSISINFRSLLRARP